MPTEIGIGKVLHVVDVVLGNLQIMKKSNYVVWPAPSTKFLKMARGPRS